MEKLIYLPVLSTSTLAATEQLDFPAFTCTHVAAVRRETSRAVREAGPEEIFQLKIRPFVDDFSILFKNSSDRVK